MMNTPVKFELAKLLKEKGFVCIKSDKFWMNGFSYPKKDYNPITYQDKDNVATISDVVMWLYEKHGIWVYVDFYNENRWFGVFRNKEGVKTELFDVLNSPTAAYEAAILYTLNNLI